MSTTGNTTCGCGCHNNATNSTGTYSASTNFVNVDFGLKPYEKLELLRTLLNHNQFNNGKSNDKSDVKLQITIDDRIQELLIELR